jgi:hypothetical protein
MADMEKKNFNDALSQLLKLVFSCACKEETENFNFSVRKFI